MIKTRVLSSWVGSVGWLAWVGLFLVVSGWFGLVPVGLCWFSWFSWFGLVRVGSGWFGLVQVGSGWFRLVRVGSG